MLIFNEKTQYDNLMANGFEKYPNKRDLVILCKQWCKDGVPKKDLKDNMIDFCRHWNSQFNIAKSEELLIGVIKALEKLEKEPPKFNFATNIAVFESEISRIKELKDKSLQKIAFVMICLAKWRNSNFIYLNSASSIKLKDIFAYAGVKCTTKQQMQYLYQLNSCGFTDVQLKPLDKFIIPCIATEGDIILNFEINENMIDHWQNLVLPHCERCRKPYQRTSGTQKYCKECKEELDKQYKLNYIRKKRNVELLKK